VPVTPVGKDVIFVLDFTNGVVLGTTNGNLRLKPSMAVEFP
jgi:hypothetical protein